MKTRMKKNLWTGVSAPKDDISFVPQFKCIHIKDGSACDLHHTVWEVTVVRCLGVMKKTA